MRDLAFVGQQDGFYPIRNGEKVNKMYDEQNNAEAETMVPW
jgi:hypothetical protein